MEEAKLFEKGKADLEAALALEKEEEDSVERIEDSQKGSEDKVEEIDYKDYKTMEEIPDKEKKYYGI